ncbi:uncharacterized protein LOC124537306 isoform X7 [Vanessa cardui]|uniref:uncharacterized protein LOC124537306 isoform X7 n=1 Tax=Vanessa cardui TaxID=171605 RepID=UPI001F13D6DA|nr:uncharacterized protein LOC124537306 isoform X7 [Vanessa cardui]
MKSFVIVLLAFVAMAAAQGVHIVDNNPSHVHVVDNNPSHVQVVDNNPSHVQVVDHNPSHVQVVDHNPSHVQVVDHNPSHGTLTLVINEFIKYLMVEFRLNELNSNFS